MNIGWFYLSNKCFAAAALCCRFILHLSVLIKNANKVNIFLLLVVHNAPPAELTGFRLYNKDVVYICVLRVWRGVPTWTG